MLSSSSSAGVLGSPSTYTYCQMRRHTCASYSADVHNTRYTAPACPTRGCVASMTRCHMSSCRVRCSAFSRVMSAHNSCDFCALSAGRRVLASVARTMDMSSGMTPVRPTAAGWNVLMTCCTTTRDGACITARDTATTNAMRNKSGVGLAPAAARRLMRDRKEATGAPAARENSKGEMRSTWQSRSDIA